jgi:hypothetical protein
MKIGIRTKNLFNNVQNKGKRVPVRKPNAVPPKTKTIQKFNNGGAAIKRKSGS